MFRWGVLSTAKIAREQVLAFGDGNNDVPMLEWAGTSFAMDNAHQLVREMADHVAPRNDDDGVARVLADVFDLGRPGA